MHAKTVFKVMYLGTLLTQALLPKVIEDK